MCVRRDDLHLALSMLQPDIQKLAIDIEIKKMEINKLDTTSMATTYGQTKYCSNHSSFKMVQQPFTLAINSPTLMATVL
jgi:hypothetical protein